MCTSDIPVVLTGHNGGKSFIVKSQLFSQCFSHLGEKTVYTKIAAMVCGIGLLVLLSALVPASGFAGVTPRSSIPASTAGPSICPAGALERSRGVSLRGLGGGRRGFRLVMAEGEGDRMAELVEKRDALLEEKAELLRKRRNELSVDISRLEREQQQTAVEAKKAQPKPRDTEEIDSSAFIFGDMAPSQEEGGAQPTRRGFLSRILTGITLTVSGLFLTLLFLSPGLEKLAYLSFSTLFEEGVIYLSNTVLKAIEAQDWESVAAMSSSEGDLTLKLLQPMIFWSDGNAGDADLKWARELQDRTGKVAIAIQSLNSAALLGEKAEVEAAYFVIKTATQDFVRTVNSKVASDLAPLSEP